MNIFNLRNKVIDKNIDNNDNKIQRLNVPRRKNRNRRR